MRRAEGGEGSSFIGVDDGSAGRLPLVNASTSYMSEPSNCKVKRLQIERIASIFRQTASPLRRRRRTLGWSTVNNTMPMAAMPNGRYEGLRSVSTG